MIASLVTAHPGRAAAAGRRAGRAGAGRPGRRHPSGGALAVGASLRRPRALRAARPGSGRARPGAVGGRGVRSGWSPSPPSGPGGLAAIRRIVDAGAVAAVGHTDATYAQARAAIDAGATVATHLFNAMRPVHHREPGPVLALLEDPRVTVELITDGVHLHPALYREVTAKRRAGPGRAGHRRDGRGRHGRRRLPARFAVRRRPRGRRQGGRHRHHRRQHRDDGPGVPVRRHQQRAPPRRGAAGCGPAVVGQSGPGPGPAGGRPADPARRPTWSCSTTS